MTPFGGDIAVSPSLARYRTIDEKDIGNNPIIFGIVVAIWVIAIAVVVRTKARQTPRHLLPTHLGPVVLGQNKHTHQGKYQITLRTGVRPGAGTSSAVYIQLFGTRGKSPDICLHHPWRPIFQRGFNDVFIATTPFNLGIIQRICLRTDAYGPHPQWYCGRIEVMDMRSNEIDETMRLFMVNDWLALDIGDGTPPWWQRIPPFAPVFSAVWGSFTPGGVLPYQHRKNIEMCVRTDGVCDITGSRAD